MGHYDFPHLDPMFYLHQQTKLSLPKASFFFQPLQILFEVSLFIRQKKYFLTNLFITITFIPKLNTKSLEILSFFKPYKFFTRLFSL